MVSSAFGHWINEAALFCMYPDHESSIKIDLTF